MYDYQECKGAAWSHEMHWRQRAQTADVSSYAQRVHSHHGSQEKLEPVATQCRKHRLKLECLAKVQTDTCGRKEDNEPNLPPLRDERLESKSPAAIPGWLLLFAILCWSTLMLFSEVTAKCDYQDEKGKVHLSQTEASVASECPLDLVKSWNNGLLQASESTQICILAQSGPFMLRFPECGMPLRELTICYSFVIFLVWTHETWEVATCLGSTYLPRASAPEERPCRSKGAQLTSASLLRLGLLLAQWPLAHVQIA